MKPPSGHIVQILATIPLSLKTFIVLPKLGSIFQELQFGGHVLHGQFVHLSHDLAKGLTFLHNNNITHLDINPSNLCFTKSYQLQIIDFDISVQLSDQDDQISAYLGTEGWMAPKLGSKDGPSNLYSPIRADRYSCGCVFRVFADMHGEDDEGLRKFADRLMVLNPSQRPQLTEWYKSDSSITPAQMDPAEDEALDKTMVTEDQAIVVEEGSRELKRRRITPPAEAWHSGGGLEIE
jgi:serine/threonine protein kinase